jgi:preprotein translocase subunit SecG
MDILIGILMVVEVLVCLLLILVVLMQRPRQEGLGASFGGDMMSQIAGAQTTNVLQKFTVYLAVTLFGLTLALAVLTSRQQSQRAGSRIFEAPPPAPAPVVEAPKAPEAEKKPEVPKSDAAKPAPAKPAEAPKKPEAPKPAAEAKAPEAPASKPAPAPATAPAAQP